MRREYNDDVAEEPRDRDLAVRALAARARAHGDAGGLARAAQGRGARRRRREPRRGGAAARGRRAAGCRSPSARTRRRSRARCSPRPRRRARRCAKDSTVTLTVAKAPPQVEVPDVLGEDVDDAANAGRGRRLQGAPARAGRRLRRTGDGVVLTQNPPSGEKRDKGSKVTLIVGQVRRRRTSTRTPRDADADPVHRRREGRRPRRRALVGARRLAGLGGRGRRPRWRRAGTRWSAVRLERDGSWTGPDGDAAGAGAGRRAARRRRRVPGAARPVRRGRHDPGPARAARRALRGRGRARLLAVHGQGRLQGGAGRRGRAAGRATPPSARTSGGRRRRRAPPSWRRSGCPCSSSRRGSAPRSGSRRSSTADELDAALETAFGHDGLVIAEAFSPGIEVECSVTGLGRPRGLAAGRGRSSRAPIGTTTRRSTRRAAWSSRSRRGWATRSIAEVRRLARETFLRAGCAGLARVDFFVEDGGRVLVNELNTLPGMTATSGFPKMWEATGVSFPEVCTRLLDSGSSATAPSAAATPSRTRSCGRARRR